MNHHIYHHWCNPIPKHQERVCGVPHCAIESSCNESHFGRLPVLKNASTVLINKMPKPFKTLIQVISNSKEAQRIQCLHRNYCTEPTHEVDDYTGREGGERRGGERKERGMERDWFWYVIETYHELRSSVLGAGCPTQGKAWETTGRTYTSGKHLKLAQRKPCKHLLRGETPSILSL